MRRDEMVEPGGIASDPEGRLWRILNVDDERILLKKLHGWKRIEIGWDEWAKGRELMVRLLLGSVAESIVRHAQCSVLIVRPSTGA